MAVSFANIFMAAVETEIIERSSKKPLIWKRYIDDVFSLWNLNNDVSTVQRSFSSSVLEKNYMCKYSKSAKNMYIDF